MTALPLEMNDRRVEVVVLDAPPKPPDYYSKLYRALGDPAFISVVANYLARRDLSRFNPGSHAVRSAGKDAAARASQSPMAERCEMLVQHWPADVILHSDVRGVLTDGLGGPQLTPAYRRTLEQFGIAPLKRVVRVSGQPARVSIIRNHEKWRDAETYRIQDELDKVRLNLKNAWDFLLARVADADNVG